MTEFKIRIFITTGTGSLLSFLMIIKQQAQTMQKWQSLRHTRFLSFFSFTPNWTLLVSNVGWFKEIQEQLYEWVIWIIHSTEHWPYMTGPVRILTLAVFALDRLSTYILLYCVLRALSFTIFFTWNNLVYLLPFLSHAHALKWSRLQLCVWVSCWIIHPTDWLKSIHEWSTTNVCF